MNILFEEQPKGTTHFFRYASGYIVWCKVEDGQNNQPIIKEWDSGNEYWVPGIYPIEHYQKIGLTSIDDLPTKNDAGPDAAAPKGATHRYQHGGETSWYRETEDGLFVWRDGSWYASTQKSAEDLARVCPFGAVTILTQEVQLADDGEDDLTWLARNVHVWPFNIFDAKPTERYVWNHSREGGDIIVIFRDYPSVFTKNKWLARRAELQNKPSWKDAPEWANWLAQWNDGAWFWCDDEIDNPPQEGDSGWYQDGRTLHLPAGEVLGDWRDTLERRPVDLSEPAVTARLTEATNNVLAAAPALMDEKFRFDPVSTTEAATLAKTLCSLLKTDAWGFDSNALAELHQLCDAELTKRDAAVCGGQKYLDAHWFERGELPPVGTVCEYTLGANAPWYKCEIKYVVLGDGVVMKRIPCGTEQYCSFYSKQPVSFRPINTERDVLAGIIKKERHSLRSDADLVDAILAAGFKRDGGAS